MIILIEDEKISQILTKKAIELTGNQCIAFSSAEEFLESSFFGDQKVQCLVLDIDLPGENGIAVLDRIRRDPLREKQPTVIMLSSHAEKSMVLECMKKGADDYFIKPVDPELLSLKLNSMIEKRNLFNKTINNINVFLPGSIKCRIKDPNHNFPLISEYEEVTVIFVDLMKFSVKSESLSLPKLADLLNLFYELIFYTVEDANGDVVSLMGDGLMISFTGENHAQRAVQTALNIAEIFSADEHTDRNKPLSISDSDFSSLIQLSVSIGINSGEAMLAAVGGHNRKSLTYIGETVNIAAHVEAETRRSDYNILITGTTFKLLPHDAFDVAFIEKSSIKGRSKEIELYGVKINHAKNNVDLDKRRKQ